MVVWRSEVELTDAQQALAIQAAEAVGAEFAGVDLIIRRK